MVARISFARCICVLGESVELFSLSDKNDEISFSECKELSGKKSH